MEELKQDQEKKDNKQEVILECIICYDIPRKPIRTNCCKQITCYAHVPQFRNKCPYCREEPFKHVEAHDIQDKVLDLILKQSLEEKEEFPCLKKKCEFKGQFKELQEHYIKEHEKQEFKESDLKKQIENQQLREIVKEKMKAGVQKRKMKMLRQLWVQAMREQLQPSYGVKKIATQEQRQAMTQHVEQCNNEGCKHVWNGRWGPFIGGDQGRTHFDLTACDAGKQLNQAINWNYDNPAY